MFARCPRCVGQVEEKDKYYGCSCGLRIWKEVARKEIDRETALQLLKDGRTGLLQGFVSKAGKPFAASLVLRDGKVEFEFPDRKTRQDRASSSEGAREPETVSVRVEAGNSGSVRIEIGPPVNFDQEVHFGLVSARLAECLGVILAAKKIQHECGARAITVSVNDLDFAKYLLNEKRPRDKETKLAVRYLWGVLEGFARWDAAFKPARRPRVFGGPEAREFPVGVFPWLEAGVRPEGNVLRVSLPDDPSVMAQFRACFWNVAQDAEDGYVMPLRAERAVRAWLAKVRRTPCEKVEQGGA